MTEETDITLARYISEIPEKPAFNQLTGTLADKQKERRFLSAIWPDRRKVAITVTIILLVSMVILSAPLLVPPPGAPVDVIAVILSAIGFVGLATALTLSILDRPGFILDASLFIPCASLAVYIGYSGLSGAMPWDVALGILMSSMFLYGVFLPHRPDVGFATLLMFLATFVGGSLLGGNLTNFMMVTMLLEIWIACVFMSRNAAMSRRRIALQQWQLEGLAGQLDNNIQDLELENRAVERAATENAALADELVLARMAAEENAAVLEVVLDNMSQGVLAFGSDARVIRSNRRFAELMQVSEDLTGPGESVYKIFEQSHAEGVIGKQWDLEVAHQSIRKFATQKSFEPVIYERRATDDRFYEVRVMPLPGGGAVSTITDVTDRKRDEERIRHKALHDPLTGLANRELFNDRLRAAIIRSRRVGHYAALAIIDLDGFKPVNDTFGHPVGDVVLKEIARIIKESVREVDTVARIGGDEFAIIFDGIGVLKDISVPVDRIFECLSKPLNIREHEVEIGLSMGIAFYPLDAEDTDGLEMRADNALLEAKRAGRNRYYFSHRAHLDGLPKVAEG